MGGGEYGGPEMGAINVGTSTPMALRMKTAVLRPTQTEILRQKKQVLEMELTAVNEALEALEKNPEIERILGLIQRAI